jgi:hypothetical protein
MVKGRQMVGFFLSKGYGRYYFYTKRIDPTPGTPNSSLQPTMRMPVTQLENNKTMYNKDRMLTERASYFAASFKSDKVDDEISNNV